MMEARREVNSNVVGENVNSGERQVGEQVGKRECGTAVHTVALLKVVTGQDNE